MGNPKHFSLELPQRCLTLIDELWSEVEKITIKKEEHLGPLTTTFLVAMAIPIFNLPVERIAKQIGIGEGYADDRGLKPELAAEVRDKLGGASFTKAPFFKIDAWSLVQRPFKPGSLNIAKGLPCDVLEELKAGAARDAAANMPTNMWVSCVRNALAHGGIAYLDGDGNQTFGESVRKIAFVSGKSKLDPSCKEYPDRKCVGEFEEVRILRISQSDFREFLGEWVRWLKDSRLVDSLAA